MFWQKPWTNPFAKCRYSLTLLELHFSGLKSILFYQEYKKMFLSCFFCSKKTLEKRSIFCRKPGTNPFAKCRFFSTLWQHYFSGPESFIFYPEYQKMFLSGFFLLRKKHIRKRSIFWQKPWTNPFAKCRFFSTLWELYFWGPKSFIFYPEYQKVFLSGFFLLKKKTYKKKFDFLTKTMD